MTLSKQKIITVLMMIYVVFTLIFPVLFVNKLCFILIMAYYFASHFRIKSYITAPILIIAIFVYGFIISLFNKSNTSLSVQFLFSVFALLMIYPITEEGVELQNTIKAGGIILVIISLIFALYASNKYSFPLPLGLGNIYGLIARFIPESFFQALMKYGEAAIGNRGFFGGFNFFAHLGTTPFLYITTCLWFEDYLKTKKIRHMVILALSLLTILISTSRALLLVTVGMMFFLFVYNSKRKSNRLVGFSVITVIVLYGISFLLQNTNVFSSDEVSNSVKIGHIISAFREISPSQFLFGKGLASYYFSSGANREIEHTEITFLDYIRYFGLPLAITIYYKLIVPMGKKRIIINEDEFKAGVIFCGYLAISLTNPVLMNSMGILVILWYWNRLYNIEKRPISFELML